MTTLTIRKYIVVWTAYDVWKSSVPFDSATEAEKLYIQIRYLDDGSNIAKFKNVQIIPIEVKILG